MIKESKEHDKVLGDSSLLHDDTTKHYALEESMLSGDANAILRGLLDRKLLLVQLFQLKEGMSQEAAEALVQEKTRLRYLKP